MSRKFYQPGVDTLRLTSREFTRYGQPHTIVAPFTVARLFGEWAVSGKVEGPLTYSGTLVKQVAFPEDAKGRRLVFRTKRDAMKAREIAEASYA